ncbi:MAG: class I SAM-dependent methyltransferase [Candidatus Riflebacteria bacterium]
MSDNFNRWNKNIDPSFWEDEPYEWPESSLQELFQCLKLKPNEIALEVGSGTGFLSCNLARLNPEVHFTGLDISLPLLNHAKIENRKTNENYWPGFIQGDGNELPFFSGSFDAVFSKSYIHMLDEPVKGLREMSRVLKDGGRLAALFSTAGQFSPSFMGNYSFDGAERLLQLRKKMDKIRQEIVAERQKESNSTDLYELPYLFSAIGLENVHLHPFPYCFSFYDNRWPLALRKSFLIRSYERFKEIVSRRKSWKPMLEKGMTESEFDEMISLAKRKKETMLNMADDKKPWEWIAGMYILVTGEKPR